MANMSGQNHLIETASLQTGSMLIWDTGTYEVLSYRPPQLVEMTDSESSSSDMEVDTTPAISEQEKLAQSFKNVRSLLFNPPLPSSPSGHTAKTTL